MTYREEARQVARDARWTFWRFIPLFVLVVVVLSGFGFVLHSAGLFGRTVVERNVFEQSYQRSEAMKARIATDEAALEEIEQKLRNPNLDENTRYNLEAQASATRMRISSARRMQ